MPGLDAVWHWVIAFKPGLFGIDALASAAIHSAGL